MNLAAINNKLMAGDLFKTLSRDVETGEPFKDFCKSAAALDASPKVRIKRRNNSIIGQGAVLQKKARNLLNANRGPFLFE